VEQAAEDRGDDSEDDEEDADATPRRRVNSARKKKQEELSRMRSKLDSLMETANNAARAIIQRAEVPPIDRVVTSLQQSPHLDFLVTIDTMMDLITDEAEVARIKSQIMEIFRNR
jgi:hypothetical protein